MAPKGPNEALDLQPTTFNPFGVEPHRLIVFRGFHPRLLMFGPFGAFRKHHKAMSAPPRKRLGKELTLLGAYSPLHNK